MHEDEEEAGVRADQLGHRGPHPAVDQQPFGDPEAEHALGDVGGGEERHQPRRQPTVARVHGLPTRVRPQQPHAAGREQQRQVQQGAGEVPVGEESFAVPFVGAQLAGRGEREAGAHAVRPEHVDLHHAGPPVAWRAPSSWRRTEADAGAPAAADAGAAE